VFEVWVYDLGLGYALGCGLWLTVRPKVVAYVVAYGLAHICNISDSA
jgi:hypothetical protein